MKSMNVKPIMDSIDIAWLTGIIEGEGCISKSADLRSRSLTVNMNDKDIIDRLYRITGEGSVKRKNIKQWVWCVTDRKGMARILLACYPLFGERRQAKVAEFISWIDSTLNGVCKLCGQKFKRESAHKLYCSWHCRRHGQKDYLDRCQS